ncbi:MAG: outer membrane lipoprotein chaperone LolA [Sutterellaceae bacterium]|nr:outer membrane lipoprotein chaperone LolA [Sutterellaceae bacterium]
MKRRELMMGAAVAAAGLLSLTNAWAAQTANAVDFLKAFTSQTQAAEGKFTQRILDKEGKPVEATANGVFMFERPGKFVWRIVKPYPQSIVSDGASLWIWDPDLNQVTVKKLSATVSTTPAAVLFGTGNIDAFFNLNNEQDKEGLHWVQAVPKEEDLTYSRIHIGFDAKGTIAAMRLEDHFGQTTELKLADVKTQAAFAPETFAFKIPEGADVLRDDN